jgi:hypothetical protein
MYHFQLLLFFFFSSDIVDIVVPSNLDTNIECKYPPVRVIVAYASEERAHCTVREKKSIKINFMIGKKRSVIFDRAMSNVYENNIFPTLPCVVVDIHDINS